MRSPVPAARSSLWCTLQLLPVTIHTPQFSSEGQNPVVDTVLDVKIETSFLPSPERDWSSDYTNHCHIRKDCTSKRCIYPQRYQETLIKGKEGNQETKKLVEGLWVLDSLLSLAQLLILAQTSR